MQSLPRTLNECSILNTEYTLYQSCQPTRHPFIIPTSTSLFILSPSQHNQPCCRIIQTELQCPLPVSRLSKCTISAVWHAHWFLSLQFLGVHPTSIHINQLTRSSLGNCSSRLPTPRFSIKTCNLEHHPNYTPFILPPMSLYASATLI